MKNLGVLLVIMAVAAFLMGQYVALNAVFDETSLNSRHLLALLEPDMIINFGIDSIRDSWVYAINQYPLLIVDSDNEVTINPAWTSSQTGAGAILLRNTLKSQCSGERFLNQYLAWRVIGFAPSDKGHAPEDVYNLDATNKRLFYYNGLYGWPVNWIKCAVWFTDEKYTLTNGDTAQYTQPTQFFLHAISPYTGIEYRIVYSIYYGHLDPAYSQYSQYFTYYILPAHIGILPYGMFDTPSS